MIDPSELIRHEVVFADKKIFKFRDYNIDPNDVIKERVRKTYFKMHKNMTVEFVKGELHIEYLPVFHRRVFSTFDDISSRKTKKMEPFRQV